jgi:hypothetical protein
MVSGAAFAIDNKWGCAMTAQARRWLDYFLHPFRPSARTAEHAWVDGLTAFAPVWAAAALFSIAGDRNALLFRDSAIAATLAWSAVATAIALILRPRSGRLLLALAAIMLVRYGIAMPVASNNKLIAAFMNFGIVVIAAHAYSVYSDRAERREYIYEHMRVVARALLAIMYFYGIFHKINTDFLDPSVSCAVALYVPLAEGFGLQDSLTGKHLAIWSTFLVEAIAIVSLYWKRYFAVGLLLALIFHFVIPISVYSWYMDFSSLVFALYILSIPREVSEQFYERCARIFRSLRSRFGDLAGLLPFIVVFGAAVVLVATLAVLNRSVPIAQSHIYQSVWVLLWVVYGGIAMILIADAALSHLPWRGHSGPRRPLWLYAIPTVLFVISAAPYFGLRTEGSITMFSNLHTEGGITNHLIVKPIYLFPYQNDVALIRDSSDPDMQRLAQRQLGLVMFSLHEHLLKNPQQWITYDLGGVRHERVTAASIGAQQHANWFERTLLIFKPVDFARPKRCTH